MVDATYIDNNRIQVVQSDEVVFDTDRPSITLLPDSQRIVITGMTVTFPSLIMARAYYRNQSGAGSICELWSTLFWQEWGPDEVLHNEAYFSANPSGSIPGPTTRNLPQQYLGSLPANSNYQDIRVRLTRTVTPPPFFGLEPPFMFPPNGEWITLPGGSCPVEAFEPMTRHFDIVRSGNDMYLRRYQSVTNTGSGLAPGGNPQNNIAVNQSGWNSSAQIFHGAGSASDGTPPTQLRPFANTELATLISRNGPSNDGTSKRPNGSGQCTGSYPDLTSTYSADIIITPGIYKP